MNKYQEALNKICNRMLCGGECSVGKGVCSLLEPLQELVDKATLKKRVFVKATPSISAHDECPVCRAKVSPIRLYCDNCGQRLE
jgi:hypothetical protein